MVAAGRTMALPGGAAPGAVPRCERRRLPPAVLATGPGSHGQPCATWLYLRCGVTLPFCAMVYAQGEVERSALCWSGWPGFGALFAVASTRANAA